MFRNCSFLFILFISLIFTLAKDYDPSSFNLEVNKENNISESHPFSNSSTLFLESIEEVEFEDDNDHKHFNTYFDNYLKKKISLQYFYSCKSINHTLVRIDKHPFYILFNQLLI